MTVESAIAKVLVGQHVAAVEHRDYDWLISFSSSTSLRIACPWRVLQVDGIALGDVDHGQRFGLAKPVDGAERLGTLTAKAVVAAISVRTDTGDLAIKLTNGVVIEVLNTSSGHEGWELREAKPSGLIAVATGGGKTEIWE